MIKLCNAEGRTHRDKDWEWENKLKDVLLSENNAPCKTYKNALYPFKMLRKRVQRPDGRTVEMTLADIDDMYTRMIACQNEEMNRKADAAGATYSLGDVVRVRAGHAGLKKRNCVGTYSAMGTIVEFGRHGRAMVRVKWLTLGLGNEEVGELSKRLYFTGRLKLEAKGPPLPQELPSDPEEVVGENSAEENIGVSFSVQAYWFGETFYTEFGDIEGLRRADSRNNLFFVAKTSKIDKTMKLVHFRVPDDDNEYIVKEHLFHDWVVRWITHGSPETDGYYLYNSRKADKLVITQVADMVYTYNDDDGPVEEDTFVEVDESQMEDYGEIIAKCCAFDDGMSEEHGPAVFEMCCSSLCKQCALHATRAPACTCTSMERRTKRCQNSTGDDEEVFHSRPLSKDCCFYICGQCTSRGDDGVCSCGPYNSPGTASISIDHYNFVVCPV